MQHALQWRDIERLGANRDWWDGVLLRRSVPDTLRPVARKFTAEQALRILAAAQMSRNFGVPSREAFQIIADSDAELVALTSGTHTAPLHLVIQHQPKGIHHQVGESVPPAPVYGGQGSIDLAALWASIRAITCPSEAAAPPPVSQSGIALSVADKRIAVIIGGAVVQMSASEAASLALQLLAAARRSTPPGTAVVPVPLGLLPVCGRA